MKNKRLKVIYFSTGGSDVKHANFTWNRVLLFVGAAIIVAIFLVGGVLGGFTNAYKSTRVETLQRKNKILTEQLSHMDNQVQEIHSKMETLETRDNDLRVYVNLPKIENETWQVGIGGSFSPEEYDLDFLTKETGNQAMMVRMLIEKIDRQIDLAEKSQVDIESAAFQKKSLLEATPSIQPVEGRITDKFGMRLDPFIEKVKMHTGVDISAEIGTKVVASANGVVDRVVSRYRTNQGYGKLVVVDHGNGYKTAYAHLNKILVMKGQKVKRWQVIGEVGNTGRSTGPHLHYEVIHNDRKINPELYIFN
ncbi:M23 family metallopeptidase [bacterium]|nr:M23 family metallopeptidase [bacterium]